MTTDVDLLSKKVEKQQAKLKEQTTLLEMTQQRADTADQDRQRAVRDADRLAVRAKSAKQHARWLAKEAKRARLRLEAGEADHDQSVKEVKNLTKSVERRQKKLVEAEAALAAARAGRRPSATKASASSRTRTRTSTSTGTAKKTTRKTAVAKRPTRRTTSKSSRART